MRRILKSGIAVLAAVLLFYAPTVFAADTFLEVKNPAIRVGDEFEVGLFLNTQNDDLNAVEGKIVFPENLLALKEIRDGDSVISLWIERPNAKNGEISFSGIVPGGYSGQKGPIFSLVFQAKQEGQGSMKIQNLRVLRNDGQGTAAAATVSDLRFSVAASPPAATPAIIEQVDTDIPEMFEPLVTSDPAIFVGKNFLVFATQDKGSGIDHYEVREGTGPFVVAESPYLLRNQNLDVAIDVKAVDRSGNVRIVTMPARKPVASPLTATGQDQLKYLLLSLAGVIIVIAAAIVAKTLWGKRTKSS